jgi:hypothetical protein
MFEMLRYSELKIPQIIDAIKRFIIQRLAYQMMNNIIRKPKLAELDRYRRNIVNAMLSLPLFRKIYLHIIKKRWIQI